MKMSNRVFSNLQLVKRIIILSTLIIFSSCSYWKEKVFTRGGYDRDIGDWKLYKAYNPGKKSKAPSGLTFEGKISYYGPGFHGKQTANGERYDQNGMTAAHKHLPFGTKLKVTDSKSGKNVVVRVNDRGPYSGGRVLDLSVGAAKKLGITKQGVFHGKCEVI
jgi:rare lipoprotein A